MITKYLPVFFSSMIKFFGGPIAGTLLGLEWWETLGLSVAGMMTSVVIFAFLGPAIQRFIGRFRKTKPKLFTSSTRRAVRIWRRFGISGIALLTPPIFMPIGGTLLAVSFKVPSLTLLFWMLCSALIWGAFLTLALYQIPWVRGIIA